MWKVFSMTAGGLAGGSVLIAGLEPSRSGGATFVIVAGSVIIAVTVWSYIGSLRR